MRKFDSIEAFRHVVGNARRIAEKYSKPLETVQFEGTVKLHGTNAGVRLDGEEVIAQSRNNVLSIGADNAGFAVYVERVKANFWVLGGFIAFHENRTDMPNYTFFGEWCGSGIQAGVALNEVDKHFVIFSVYDHDTERFLSRDWMRHMVETEYGNVTSMFNDVGIYFIYQIPTYNVTVDFNAPEQVVEELERLTLNVEEECPWGAFRGVSGGVGEGIVWVRADDVGNPDWWFKTKGVKHQKGAKKTPTISADPVKTAAIRDLVELILPEWRLEQGLKEVREAGYSLDSKATGQYLQWISKDIIKEESDQIAASTFTWKEISPKVIDKARFYYLTYINTHMP